MGKYVRLVSNISNKLWPILTKIEKRLKTDFKGIEIVGISPDGDGN